MKTLVCLLVLALVPLLYASQALGRFELPATLTWTRATDADAAFGGLCVEITDKEGVSNLLVLDNEPVSVVNDSERELMRKAYLAGFATALGGGSRHEMKVTRQSWMGLAQYNAAEKRTLYMGSIVLGTEIFKVYLVRQSQKPPGDDLQLFLNAIRVAAPGAVAAAVKPVAKGIPATTVPTKAASVAKPTTVAPAASKVAPPTTPKVVAAPLPTQKGTDALPAWIKDLPDVPVLQAVELAPGVDFSACNRAEYDGLVRSAREACREILGKMSTADTRRFDAQWEPMLAFPAPKCVAYLEKVIPLLEQTLSVKAALTENLLLNEKLWIEAGYAAAYTSEAGAELMQTVARQTAILASLRQRARDLGKALAALGEPPDPRALQQEAVARHEKAMKVLGGLVGGTSSLEGAYDLLGGYSFSFYKDDPKKPMYGESMLQLTQAYDVFLPLKSAAGGVLVYYHFKKRVLPPKTKSSGMDFSFLNTPEKGEFHLLETTADGWVSYGLDEESSSVNAVFFRPTADSLLVDDYTLRAGKITDVYRSEYRRRTLTAGLQQFMPGKSLKSVEAELAADPDEVLQSVELCSKGRKLFNDFVQGGGHLPEMPLHGEKELYWVLKSSTVKSSFPSEKLVSQSSTEEVRIKDVQIVPKPGTVKGKWSRETTTFSEEPVASSGKAQGNDARVYIPDPSREFVDYPDSASKRAAATTKKVSKKKVENFALETSWSPAPLIVPDKGYWPLEIRGNGAWRFSFNHPFDKKGEPIDQVRVWPKLDVTDSLFLFDRAPTKEDFLNGSSSYPSDVKLMEFDSKTQGGSQNLNVVFCANNLGEVQREYPISLTVITGAGWARQDLVYELKIMSPREAADLLRKTAALDAKMASALAAVKVEPKLEKTPVAASQASSAEASSQQERVAFHQANIAFCQQEISRLEVDLQTARRDFSAGKATEDTLARINELEFRLTCTRSNSISEQDLIAEVKTGKPQFSRTPFDDMCLQQVRHKVQEEAGQFDAAARARRKAELLAGKLDGVNRDRARQMISRHIQEGGALHAQKWIKLNGTLQGLYQGPQYAELAAIDEDIAWKSFQLSAAENIKEGADKGMAVASLFGGPVALSALYQTGTGYAEGGVLEGVKRGVSTLSDAADVAISGYEGWKSGGVAGMVEGAGWSIIMNKGPEAALGRLRMRSVGADTKFAEVPSGVSVPRKPPIDLKATRAAQFKQELEYGETLAEDFFSTHMQCRKAELSGTAAPEELARLRTSVRQKAAAVAHSMPAKSYLKYKATPIKGKAYTESMDGILKDTTEAFNWGMRGQGYNEQSLYSCRNASSVGTGMDTDLALRERPDMLPVSGPGGTTVWKKNDWLTKNGKSVSLKEYQEVGSKTLQEAYKKVTGGYHAKSSFVDMTTSLGAESYTDLTWLKLPKAGKHSDTAQVTRKLDEFFGKIDVAKTPDSLKITGTKADIMFSKHPELRPLGAMMEACRGTAKDIDMKFKPLLQSKIRELEKVPVGKRTPQQVSQLRELESTQGYLAECLKCFEDIGQGKIPPHDWEGQFKQVTGGSDVGAVIRRLTNMTLTAAGH